MLACVLYIHMHACICIDHCPCWVYTVELHDDAQKAIAIDVYSASCMNKNPDNWFEYSCALHMEKSTDTKVAVCKFLDFIPRYVP